MLDERNFFISFFKHRNIMAIIKRLSIHTGHCCEKEAAINWLTVLYAIS